jgi:hypothetical protein
VKGTLISFEFSPVQLKNIGTINVEVVFLTIAALDDVVDSITVFPPVLVQPRGPVTTL